MDIIHATDFLPKYHKVWGGAELAAYNTIKVLSSKENKQSIVSTKPEVMPKDDDFELFVAPVLSDYLGKFSDLLTFWAFDPLSYSYALKLFKKVKPEILHLHNFRGLSFSLVSAAKKLNLPVVFSIYDNWAFCPNHTLINKKSEFCRKFHNWHCFNCTYIHKKISAFFRKPLFNYFLKDIDRFVVLSNNMMDLLSKYGIPKEKITFVPLPLSQATKDSDSIVSSIVEDNSILFVGWASPHKGLKVAIEAFSQVVKKYPNSKIYVIETGQSPDYRNQIINFIENNNIGDKVVFLGKKNNKEVQEYLKRVELVVVPEQWPIAWPIFLTEAMYSQKPIVASNIGDISFFIKDFSTGFTVDPKNHKEFAEKIIYCFENKDKVRVMGVKVREEIIKICDDKNIYNKLISLYNEIANKKD